MPSAVTERAQAFVSERLPQARGLGVALADVLDDPDAFTATLREGLQRLSDPEYEHEQERVAPGFGDVLGVRNPLMAAIARQIREPLRRISSTWALALAERLIAEDEREIVLFSHVCLRRALPNDPEQSWQLMRRLARRAHDWIGVDELAELYAYGILLEQFRWAELEQLVFSLDKWERRLVGSTIARLPFELPKHQRSALGATSALTLIKSLLGDADPDVQKALSWALRSWNEVDSPAVEAFLRVEAVNARSTDDGHSAWVLRDALTWPGTPLALQSAVRATLQGVRRRPNAPSTSAAASIAGNFIGLDRMAEAAVAMQGDRQRMGRG
ncbi:MAG TPA: DNA alkylation repair protein [Candidatus Limnocylindrales bacterium]|nr:DNA alkylation repair protein [Candidatus Limnocylindrales bacterium]